jgi:pyridoxal biosynthesis lyase PdxS
LDTKWGRLFQQYGNGEVVMPGIEPEQAKVAALAGAVAAGGALFIGGRLLSGLLARRS